jgi:hypothetical protein
LSVCRIIKNIVCTLKWPGLKAKIRKMKKLKFVKIDSRFCWERREEMNIRCWRNLEAEENGTDMEKNGKEW